MLFAHLMAVAAGSATVEGFARPSAPAFTVATGAGAGEYVLTVTNLPISWGDLSAPGDGLGEAGILEWWNAVDGWQVLADPAAAGGTTVTLDQVLWGAAEIMVRGVSAAGRAGTPATVSEQAVTADGAPVTADGVPVTVFLPA